MNRTVAALRLPELPLLAVRRREPALAGSPLAVVDHGRVVCADAVARRAGVHPGMDPGRLPPWVVSRPPANGEMAELGREVVAGLLQLTPLVEEAGPAHWVLELTGTRGVHRTPEVVALERWLRQLEGRLETPGISGVASNRQVALMAGEAARRARLGGLRVLPGQEAAFLAPLPVTLLPQVGRAMAGRLARLGIRRVGELVAAPEGDLVRAFGPRAIRWRAWGLGVDPAPIGAGIRLAPPLRQVVEPTPAQQDNRVLAWLVGEACECLGGELRRRGGVASRLRVALTDWDGVQRERLVVVRPATNRSRELAVAARAGMEALFTRRVMVRRVEVVVVEWGDRGMGTLFPEWEAVPAPLARPGLDEALDRIRERFGWEAIRRGWGV